MLCEKAFLQTLNTHFTNNYKNNKNNNTILTAPKIIQNCFLEFFKIHITLLLIKIYTPNRIIIKQPPRNDIQQFCFPRQKTKEQKKKKNYSNVHPRRNEQRPRERINNTGPLLSIHYYIYVYMLQGLNRIHYERFFSLTISPVARQIERKRADEFIGFRDSVQRRKQRVTGVEMRAAGIPGIPAWDPWRWMDRGHEYTDPVQRRCRAAESYSGRELARGEKQAKAVTLLLFTLCHFSLPPLLLSFIPFFSSFAFSTIILSSEVVNFDSILRLIRGSPSLWRVEGVRGEVEPFGTGLN